MTTKQVKPNVFIGSSREAIHYARAVSACLEHSCQVNPWFAGTFQANDYTMEALERELEANDFGIFVFAADDVALIRNQLVFITRDNTLFELGLFWGRLGRKRVYCIIPRHVEERDDLLPGESVSSFHLLSDLAGLTLLHYQIRKDRKYAAAVDTACGEILKAIETEKRYEDPKRQLARKQAELDRKQSILHFFWEYIRNVSIADESERYSAFAEAIRNSFLAPPALRTIGAAIWMRSSEEWISQVGGNVGRGRSFHLQDNENLHEDQQRIYVVDAFLSGKWSFFHRREIAEVYILCYPLSKRHVLSVHISGSRMLTATELGKMVEGNDELLATITHLVGGEPS
ncbi:TIR domain-containing protein [Paenibacillus sp. HB172176]|uniref:TIR domain-containing protein n=1 Tax=Paenibacillus sp. HB172176 TaxID=2493690 RepID=UPI001F0DFB45|nr:TIR domain-containing protein [Paenibacillus sp. HB172176]